MFGFQHLCTNLVVSLFFIIHSELNVAMHTSLSVKVNVYSAHLQCSEHLSQYQQEKKRHIGSQLIYLKSYTFCINHLKYFHNRQDDKTHEISPEGKRLRLNWQSR